MGTWVGRLELIVGVVLPETPLAHQSDQQADNRRGHESAPQLGHADVGLGKGVHGKQAEQHRLNAH